MLWLPFGEDASRQEDAFRRRLRRCAKMRDAKNRCTRRRLCRVPDERSEAGRRQTENRRGELAFARRFDGWIRRRTPKIFRSFIFRYPRQNGGSKPRPTTMLFISFAPHASGAHSRQMNANYVRRLGSRGGTPLVRGAGAQSPRIQSANGYADFPQLSSNMPV